MSPSRARPRDPRVQTPEGCMSEVVGEDSHHEPTEPLKRHGALATASADDLDLGLRAASAAVEARCDDEHDRTLARVKEGLGLSGVDSEAATLPRFEGRPLAVHEAVILAAAKAGLGLDPPPVRFGRYAIERRLDGGGMGVVHVALDTDLDRRVALKLLRRHSSVAGDELFAQAQLEAQAMAKLQHPRVAAVYDVGLHDDQAYIAMELVHGEPLDPWRRRNKPDPRQLLAMYVEIGRGLAAIHHAGLVHGDFKPDNILVEPLSEDDRKAGLAASLPLGKPKIVDFGMALRLGDQVRGGTPEYMPPEQIGAEPTATYASDQYSFCVALFEALLSCHPYVGQTFEDFAETARRSDPEITADELRVGYIIQISVNLQRSAIRWPEQLRKLPRWLRSALARGLAARPEDRFPGMEPLLAILDRPRVQALRRRRAGFAALAGLVGAVTAFAITAATAKDRCDNLGDPVAELWNEAVHARLGDALGPQTAALFEPYADAWRTLRRDVCEATLIRGEASDALHDARVRCLDDRLREATSVRDAIERRDITAVDASQRLRPPELCALLDGPTELVPAGKEAERDRIAAQLADEVFTAELVGDHARGLSVADGLLTDALAVGHRPLVAAVLYQGARLALLDHRNHHPDDHDLRSRGEHDLDAAIRLAARAGDEALYTDAAIFGLRFHAVAGPLPPPGDEALLTLDLPHDRQNPRIRADLSDVQGLLAYQLALASPPTARRPHLETARAELEHAISYYAAHDLEIEHAKALENLGDVHLALGDPAAASTAYDAATTLWTDVLQLAPTYLGTLHARRINAAQERDDGTAPALCEQALAWLTTPAADDERATQAAQIDLSCAAAYWSDPTKALPHARRAAAAPLVPRERAAALLIATGLLLRLDTPTPAQLDEAATLIATLDGLPQVDPALAEAYRGHLHIRRKNFSAAEVHLEAAREHMERDGLPPDEATSLLLDLAEVRLMNHRQGVNDALEQADRHLHTAEQAAAPDAPSSRALPLRLEGLRRAAQRDP